MGDKKHEFLSTKPYQLILALGLIFFFTGLAVLPSQDPDLWWHLKVGELIEKQRTIPRTDLFAYPSSEQPFIAHGWLSEVLFYNFYRLAGWGGVFWLKALIIAATLAVLFLIMVRRGGSFLLATLFLCLTIPVSMIGWEIRPQILGYFCFSLLLLWLDSRRQEEKTPFPLPVLFFLWANLHASVVLGLGILGLYTLASAGENFKNREKESPLFDTRTKGLLKIFIVSALAALINPYHYQVLLHPLLHTTSEVFPRMLSEWQPPNWSSAPLFFALLGATLGWSLLQRRKLPWGEGLMLLTLALLGITALRHIPYFALAAGPFWFAARGREAEPEEQKKLKADNPRLAYLLAAIFLGVSSMLPWWGRSWQALNEEYRWPQGAATFVQRQDLPGNMYNFFDWGGYLTYRLWPRQKVFILGISTDQEVFMDAFAVLGGGEKALKTLDRYEIDYIITPALFSSGGMLPYIPTLYLDPQWVLIYQDRQSAILLRNRLPYQGLAARYRLPKERLITMAREQAEALLDQNPGNCRARLSKALSLAMGGERTAALKEVETVLGQHPSREILAEAQFMQRKLKSHE
jgi:hypothetical protein